MTSTENESTGPADDRNPTGEVPNPDTGAGIGAGDPSTFEPEEDPESVPDPE